MALRGLVVGCGGMGRGWMENIRANPRAELVGVVDVRGPAAAEAAAKFGLPPERAFTDLRCAIADTKPDFVADITIPEAHSATTITALGNGLPVIGEKPLAHSMAAARRRLKAAEKAGKLAMVSQSRRYDRNHAALSATLRGDAIGTITTQPRLILSALPRRCPQDARSTRITGGTPVLRDLFRSTGVSPVIGAMPRRGTPLLR